MTRSMEILAEGSGELLGWHDPDENRAWVRENKPRGLIDKRMSVAQAVAQVVHDSDYIAFDGFGHIRVPMSGSFIPSLSLSFTVRQTPTASRAPDLARGPGSPEGRS